VVEEFLFRGGGVWGVVGGGGWVGWVLGGVLLLITLERTALCPTELLVLCPEYRVQGRKEKM
jgi:hypothetical protein